MAPALSLSKIEVRQNRVLQSQEECLRLACLLVSPILGDLC